MYDIVIGLRSRSAEADKSVTNPLSIFIAPSCFTKIGPKIDLHQPIWIILAGMLPIK